METALSISSNFSPTDTSLADEKGRSGDFALYNTVERLGKEIISEKRKIYKCVSVNVDFYSGFVYSMLDMPVELFTPSVAIARITGWSAHRIEELINTDKIISADANGKEYPERNCTGENNERDCSGKKSKLPYNYCLLYTSRCV